MRSKLLLCSGIVVLVAILYFFAKNTKTVSTLGSSIKNIHKQTFVQLSPTQFPEHVYAQKITHMSPTALPTQATTPQPTASTVPTSTLVPTIIPTPVSTKPWGIESIDAMKETKDAVCNPRSLEWINTWLAKAVELGANYVAISTPYDNPSCGSATDYTKTWVDAIRSHGLHVWHRHMPLAFEGIYNVQKSNATNYLDTIKNYIATNPNFFQSGDIFTPIPEPQNGGIQGVTYCSNTICQFSSAASFNQWLRDAMSTTNDELKNLGKDGIKVGYFGFDGFVAWGDNNPDWHGILEDSTVDAMENITIDHYPELVHETMADGLVALSAKYPNTPIVIGEWGTVTGGDTEKQIQEDMQAAKNNSHVVGFNYWQFGPQGSGEQLIDNSFTNLPGFVVVQNFYK